MQSQLRLGAPADVGAVAVLRAAGNSRSNPCDIEAILVHGENIEGAVGASAYVRTEAIAHEHYLGSIWAIACRAVVMDRRVLIRFRTLPIVCGRIRVQEGWRLFAGGPACQQNPARRDPTPCNTQRNARPVPPNRNRNRGA